MYWHIDTDIISIVILIMVYICNLKLTPQEKDFVRNKRFTRCLESGIGIAIIDIAASVIMEVPTSPFLYHILMTAYFVFIEFVIVEWILYVLTILYQDNVKWRKSISHAVLTLYSIYALFCCANPWTGLIYSLGINNEYSRGPFFGTMLILYACYAMLLFVLIIIRWKHIPKEFPSKVLLITPIIIAVGIVIQLSIPGWLFILPSYMICVVLAFLFLQTTRAQNRQRLVEELWSAAETDNLTGLYNRFGMEAMVRKTLTESFGEDVVVLIADIDDLKKINDTMGHSEGDRAIKMVAAQLKQHFCSTDTIVRYGGDEFLTFFTGNFKCNEVEISLQHLAGELRELRIGEHNDVPLYGSVGAAVGVVGVDTFDTLCRKADIALYHVKRNGKNGHALYNPAMEDIY